MRRFSSALLMAAPPAFLPAFALPGEKIGRAIALDARERRGTPCGIYPPIARSYRPCQPSQTQEIVDEDLSQMHASEKALRSAGSSPTAAAAAARREGNAEKTL